jgi:dienelactone hydrolase
LIAVNAPTGPWQTLPHPPASAVMRTIPTVLAVLATLVTLAAGAATAAEGDMVETAGFLNVTIKDRLVRLESLVVRPETAAGRLPIALIAHGKPVTQGLMGDQHARDLAPAARDLARRGWLAVVVMRRGFGASDGPQPVPLTCASRSLLARLDNDADELAATLAQVARRPDADATRVIAIGASAGGMAVNALAARNPPGLAAVVSVSGGLRFLNCPKEDALVAAFAQYGMRSRVPSLWIYAKNDSFFPPALVERMHATFLGAGGDVKLVMFEPEGKEGHQLFASSTGRMKWLPEMDSFLRFLKLPTWTRADVNVLMRKLDVDESKRGFVESYIAAPTEKAMGRGVERKALTASHGSRTLENAKRSALDACRRNNITCSLIMENDRLLASPQRLRY